MIGWKVCPLSLSQCTDIYEWMRGMGYDWMESLSTKLSQCTDIYKWMRGKGDR